MKRIAVFDGDASYQVHIGANLLQQAWPTMSTFIPEGQVLILSDDHVAPLYLESLKRKVHIVAHQVDTFVMPHGEMHKTLEQFQLIIDFLIQRYGYKPYEISNGKLKQHKLREKYDFINLFFKV